MNEQHHFYQKIVFTLAQLPSHWHLIQSEPPTIQRGERKKSIHTHTRINCQQLKRTFNAYSRERGEREKEREKEEPINVGKNELFYVEYFANTV